MRFPDSILNCVVFISAGDEKLPTFRGTGFIVGIVEPRTKKAFWHLVTAKHVADHLKAGPFMIGVNLKADEKVLVRASEYKWWYHPVEPTLVDAAVGVFATKQVSEYKLEYVPEEIFATDECIATNNIGVGDELGIVGLFTKFYGTTRLWAIVRSGNIAMMPGDRIPIDGFGPMKSIWLRADL